MATATSYHLWLPWVLFKQHAPFNKAGTFMGISGKVSWILVHRVTASSDPVN